MVINKINFPIYEIMIVLSVLIGALYIFLSLKNEKIKTKHLFIFYILFFILSISTGKIYTYIITGGLKTSLSAYGGLVGAILAAIIYEKFFKKDGKIIKYTIISLPLIYAFTKIGCLFVGCCYGIPYNGPFAVTYPQIKDEPLFPIQLLEIIAFFIIFIICNTLKNKNNINYITLSLVAISKFLLDFLRYNHLTETISPNQIFSLILLIITIVFYIIEKKHKTN